MAIPQDKKYTGREIETIQKWRRLNIKEYFSHHPQTSPARTYLMTACFASTLVPVDFNVLEVQKKLKLQLPSGFDLTHAKMGLRILAAIGEASNAVSPLKSAALVALEIVEAAEAAKDNQDRCKLLAEDIFKLMEATRIEEFTLTGRPGEEIMKGHMKEFIDNLKAISALLGEMLQRNKAKRFGYGQADAGTLDKCEAMVKKSQDLFMLHLALENRRNIQSIDDKINILIERHILTAPPAAILSPGANQNAALPQFQQDPPGNDARTIPDADVGGRRSGSGGTVAVRRNE